MKAIQIDRYGGPEVLVRRELPIPAPGPDEVLVRLKYSGINFMDIHTRQGKYAGSRTYSVSLPTTLGVEGSGYVESVGSGVREFRAGDRVAYCICWGSYAEYAVVPAWRLVPVPEGVPLDLAAASMFHGLTAHYLANDVGELAPGVTCLVLSASGGIGQLLVQFGKRMGARVLAVTSSEAKAKVARERGAAESFLYDDGKFADTARELTNGRGVDVVFDPIGRPTFRASLRAARTKGLIVSFGSVGGPITDINPIELGEAGSLFLTRPRLADHLADAPTIRGRSSAIFGALLDGTLTIAIAGRYSFDQVEEAHENLEQRRTIGKPILEIS